MRTSPNGAAAGGTGAGRLASPAAARFGREAERWDQIYSGAGAWWSRWRDRLTRGSVRRRFARTFEITGPLDGRSVLDLGCGTGRFLVRALDAGASRTVGIDVAPEMLALARRHLAAHPRRSRSELRLGDLDHVDLHGRFDVVLAMGLFDYVPDAGRLLARARGWTADLLIASFPARLAPRALPRWIYWRARGLPIRLFDRAEVHALAVSSGFTPIDIEKIGPTWLLVARRADGGRGPR